MQNKKSHFLVFNSSGEIINRNGESEKYKSGDTIRVSRISYRDPMFPIDNPDYNIFIGGKKICPAESFSSWQFQSNMVDRVEEFDYTIGNEIIIPNKDGQLWIHFIEDCVAKRAFPENYIVVNAAGEITNYSGKECLFKNGDCISVSGLKLMRGDLNDPDHRIEIGNNVLNVCDQFSAYQFQIHMIESPIFSAEYVIGAPLNLKEHQRLILYIKP